MDDVTKSSSKCDDDKGFGQPKFGLRSTLGNKLSHGENYSELELTDATVSFSSSNTILAASTSLDDKSMESNEGSSPVVPRNPPYTPELFGDTSCNVKHLPRHLKRLEFARACTNLHHSILADQSSPESSPTHQSREFTQSLRRKHFLHSDLTSQAHIGNYCSLNNHKSYESLHPMSSNFSLRTASDSSCNDDSDEAELDDPDDPMYTGSTSTSTSYLLRNQKEESISPFKSTFSLPSLIPTSRLETSTDTPCINLDGLTDEHNKATSINSLDNISISTSSNIVTDLSLSPFKDKLNGETSSRKLQELIKCSRNRRESISLSTNDLHITSENESGDDLRRQGFSTGVVRRAVIREGNLLPKTRAFGRIKAELLAESRPVETEASHEVQFVRQIRGLDTCHEGNGNEMPELVLPGNEEKSAFSRNYHCVVEPCSTFPLINGDNRRGETFDDKTNQALNLDKCDYETTSEGTLVQSNIQKSHSLCELSCPTSSYAGNGDGIYSSTTDIMTSETYLGSSNPEELKDLDNIYKNTKRLREDDCDRWVYKRRAVSPSLSVLSSPILSPVSLSKTGSGCGGSASQTGSLCGQIQRRRTREGSVASMSVCSVDSSRMSSPLRGPMRFGLLGYFDTNEDLMKMSLD